MPSRPHSCVMNIWQAKTLLLKDSSVPSRPQPCGMHTWQAQNSAHDHSSLCRCTIQSLQDQQLSAPSKHVGSVLGTLDVPKPDRGPSCKAMIGYCQALTVWMAASVTILQRLVDLNKQASVAKIPEQQLSVEASSKDLSHAAHSCLLCFKTHCCWYF